MPRLKRWLSAIVKTPRRWEALQKAVGMSLMPEPLGCGSFGCVFAAADPSSPWVVKITIDPHEAAMWNVITSLAESEGYGEDGFTKIKEIVRILPDYTTKTKRTKIHAIVREAIAPLLNEGGFSEFSKQIVKPALLPTSMYASQNMLQQVERPARDLIEIVNHVFNYHEAARYIYDRRPGSRARREQSMFGPQSLDQAKSRLQRSIDMMQGGYSWVLADTLGMLLNQGIVLNDLRPMNIGWRFLPEFLPDNEDNVLVLFDPGFTDTGKRSVAEPREVHIPNFEWYVPETIAR
jgi:hypothetical protein